MEEVRGNDRKWWERPHGPAQGGSRGCEMDLGKPLELTGLATLRSGTQTTSKAWPPRPAPSAGPLGAAIPKGGESGRVSLRAPSIAKTNPG